MDVSNQQRRQDDDRDGERTLEVKYLHAESGIMAMRGLSGGPLSILVSMATPAQLAMARPDGVSQRLESFTRKTTYGRLDSSGVRA